MEIATDSERLATSRPWENGCKVENNTSTTYLRKDLQILLKEESEDWSGSAKIW